MITSNKANILIILIFPFINTVFYTTNSDYRHLGTFRNFGTEYREYDESLLERLSLEITSKYGLYQTNKTHHLLRCSHQYENSRVV